MVHLPELALSMKNGYLFHIVNIEKSTNKNKALAYWNNALKKFMALHNYGVMKLKLGKLAFTAHRIVVG